MLSYRDFMQHGVHGQCREVVGQRSDTTEHDTMGDPPSRNCSNSGMGGSLLNQQSRTAALVNEAALDPLRWGPHASPRDAKPAEAGPPSLCSLSSGTSCFSTVSIEIEAQAAAAEQPHEWQGRSRYHEVRELQRGSSGVVHLAMDIATLKRVAIKLVPREKVDLGTAREIASMRQCMMHPHVAQFRETFRTRAGLAIVMEYASGGDLREYVEQWDGPTATPTSGLPETQARWFFQQLALAVEYCHGLGIAHRDIKLENALLDRSGPRAILKLCDFGYASRNQACPSDPVNCRRAVGTPEYMAPELLSGKSAPYDGKQADIWSMGVLLFVMLAGAFPFWREEDDNMVGDASDSLSRLRCMMSRILSGDYEVPAFLSPSCTALLRGMLTVDPSQRFTMRQVLASEWFQKDLPTDCFAVNQQLLATPAQRRTAYCRQSEKDIMTVVGSVCGLL